MSKYLRLMACLVCILALSGCSLNGSKDFKYPAEDKDTFEATVGNWIQSVSQMTDDQIDDSIEQMSGTEGYESIVNALNSYKDTKKEIGEFKEIKEFTYSEGDEEGVYNAVALAKFKKRDCKINITFTVAQNAANLETLSFEPVYSLKETLKQAGMNTMLGMGTVFAVLILIAFIISLFKIIYNIQNATKEKEVLQTIENNKNEIAKADFDIDDNFITDDEEIVAVIAAAIRAYEGETSDGFVVRSIRKIR